MQLSVLSHKVGNAEPQREFQHCIMQCLSIPMHVSLQPQAAARPALTVPLQVCLDKKLTTAEDLRAAAEQLEARSGSNLGAKLTVRAWTDSAFKVAACLVQI